MTMKSALKPVAIAVSVVAAGMTLPTIASAETSASFAVSNFYLWRGTNLSGASPAVSGSLDYSHASGLYAGVWVSSEGDGVGQETDFYVGFGGEAGGISYDVNLTAYEYPEAAGSEHYGDFSELIIGLGFGGASFTLYDALQGGGAGYMYYTLGYSMDKLGVTYGGWSFDDEGTEYAHLDISYAATDDLSLTVTTVIDDDDSGMDTDPLFNVAWSKSFDL